MSGSLNQSPKWEIFQLLQGELSWDLWYEIEKKYFSGPEWVDKDPEKMIEESSRPPFTHKGMEWLPISDPCEIDRELRDFYEYVQSLIARHEYGEIS